MNISQVIAKATKEVDLVKDGNIYYLLLNQGDVDFTFTDKIIIQINAILDEVEKSTGPAVLVTVSAAKKRFSTGFSLEHFSENQTNKYKAIVLMQQLLGRILTLNVPTMAILNGHTYAGGLIFALCHDFRTMGKNVGKLCLNEININFSMPTAYSQICKDLMPIQICRDMVMGRAILPQEAYDRQVISSMYDNDVQANAQIQAFAKEFAPKAANRALLKDIKQKLHWETVNVCQNQAFSPFDIDGMANFPPAKL